MIDISENERRHAFSVWLRTGRLPTNGIELKFNPWHDPKDGRFTFAHSGNYQGRGWGDGGFTGGGGGRSGGSGASGRGWETPEERKQPERTTHPPAMARATHAPSAIRDHLPAKQIRPSAQSNTHGMRPATSPRRETVAEPVRHLERNGYDYEIDAGGRTRRVSGKLDSTRTRLRSRTAQARAGGTDRRPSDDGGHYIAARFNGPTEAFNHFAQDSNFNRGRYRALEGQWAREKKAGGSVFVKIVPTYEGTSQRPSMINVWFTIKGHTESVRIPNENGKKIHGK